MVNKDCCFQLLYNFLVTFIPIGKVFVMFYIENEPF